MTRRLALTAVLLTVVAACATTGDSTNSRAPVDDRVWQAFAELAPSKSNQVHKVSVRVGGRDLVLTGYLALDREHGFRGMAVDEFGGKLLDFTSCDGTRTVAFAPPQLKPHVIKGGPVGDLELAFLPPPATADVQSDDGALQEVSWQRGESRIQCLVDVETVRVVDCEERRGRRLVRKLTFRYGGTGRGGLTGFGVHHRGLHYRSRVDVLEVGEGADGPPRWCVSSPHDASGG